MCAHVHVHMHMQVAHVLMLSEPGLPGVGGTSVCAAMASTLASACKSDEGTEPDVMTLMQQVRAQRCNPHM